MSQTYHCLYYHIVFSTKHRKPTIDVAWRNRLWKYLGGITKRNHAHPIEIGGTVDHIHLLVSIPPTLCVADYVKIVKAGSSGWVHQNFPGSDMWWQDGYGAFTVSASGLLKAQKYVLNQEEHHREQSFQDEVRLLLKRHRVPFDDRTMWD